MKKYYSYHYYGIETQIIAASVRSPLHVVAVAKAGEDIATVPYPIIMKMIKHPLTYIDIERFIENWEDTFGK